MSRGSAQSIRASALGIGFATGAYALSFGAITVASGLSPLQAQALSLFMFTGASQFAFVGVLGAGGGAVAAVLTAWMLGARNGIYGLTIASLLRPRGAEMLATAQFTIDESTAMAIANDADRGEARKAFWWTGLSIYVLWNIGTLLGALGASALSDPGVLGLDAAIPAGFMALLWPRLRDRQSWAIAACGALVALALIPVTRPGIPVLASALVAVAAGVLIRERK